MAYLVLARRARPQTFDEVVGQQVAVRTLQNALAANRVPHALMFSGVRGVGKTTLARIMAKALNCVEGPTPSPCNRCPSCREITAGGSLDLHEIDGASNRGIQEIRELKEGLRFMPASSRHKIVIIDEVHMLTSEAFNALLKTLEEPPAHVYFVLATTEPHKVPVTIQSRCQRYELKRVSRQELSAHFVRLLEREGVSVEAAALELIVRESEGSVRDGLSLLDQVLSYAGTAITVRDVVEVLGVVDRDLVLQLLQALLARDMGGCLALLDTVFAQGMDFKHFINGLLETCRALVVCRVTREPARLLDMPEQELEILRRLGAAHEAETLLALFNLLFDGCERASRSVRPRLALELALVRAVQAGSLVPVGEILARLDRLLGDDSDEELAALAARHAPAAPVSPPVIAGAAPLPTFSAGHPPTLDAQPPAPAARDLAADVVVEADRPAAVAASPLVEAPAPVVPSVPPADASRLPPGQDREGERAATRESVRDDAVPAGRQGEPRSGVDEGTHSPAIRPEASPTVAPPPDPTAVEEAVEKKIRRRWDGFIDYVKGRKEWMAHALRRCDSFALVEGRLVIRFQLGADCVLFQQRENLRLLSEFALDFFQENIQIRFEALDGISCNIAGEDDNGPRRQRLKLANHATVQLASEIFQGRIGDIRVGPRFRGEFHESAENQDAGTEGESE